jgi:hypothetical protein
LIAVEPDGRLVIIEVKLRRNSEAKKAVVAQILAYAAGLYGLTYDELERGILSPHLARRGHGSLLEAVRAADQDGTFDEDAFAAGVVASLESGRIRLVLVLDDAPPDLVRLVGYLEAMTDGLVVDLITVASYEVGGSRVLVPQRIEPGHDLSEIRLLRKEPRLVSQGADGFERWVAEAAELHRPALKRMLEWARALERNGSADLFTTHDARGGCHLRPFLRGEQRGLVTIWSDASLALWSSVMQQRSPEGMARLERRFAPEPVPANLDRGVADDVLAELAAAYVEAARRSPPAIGPSEHGQAAVSPEAGSAATSSSHTAPRLPRTA